MITSVTDRETLDRAIGGYSDIYAGKVRSFADGYGFGYPFCRFWVQDGSLAVCAYYTDAAIAGELNGDPEELRGFLTCAGIRRVLMPYELYERLGLPGKADAVHLMCRGSDVKNTVGSDKESIETDAPLGQIYEIVRSVFDIDCDKWYTDISHMLRHGIARIYRLGNGTCAIRMYASLGAAYLSYVCTKPELRGKGLASRLIRGICRLEAEEGNDTYILCGDNLRGFYERLGFLEAGRAADITFTNRTREAL